MTGWPPSGTPKSDPRPHRTALKTAIHARRENELKAWPVNPRDMTLVEYRLEHGGLKSLSDVRAAKDKDADHWEDMHTVTGALWSAREREMNARQRARARFVKKYRPIQTLDGLDPHWSRNGLCGYAAALKALMCVGWVNG